MNHSIVVDDGSFTFKVGFAGDDEPKAIFRSVVGKTRTRNDVKYESTFVGEEALSRRGSLTMRLPVENGRRRNWDVTESLFRYAFDKVLQVKPEEHPVLLAESPTIMKEDRKEYIQLLFETFHCPWLCLASQPVLTLYATGRVTGTVVQSGENTTCIVPVIEGSTVLEALKTLDIAGHSLTTKLGLLLAERDYIISLHSMFEYLRELKETMCYVAPDFEEEMVAYYSQNKKERTFTLPDGRDLAIGDEMFRCPEILFQPSHHGIESDSITHLTHKSISQCPAGCQALLYENILLSGGSTLFSGMAERIEKELCEQMTMPGMKPKVHPSGVIKEHIWVGGSIFASNTAFPEMCISKATYEECGPDVFRCA